MNNELRNVQEKELHSKNIHELRDFGRSLGVLSPTLLSKSDLVNSILDIIFGTTASVGTETRGRPASEKIINPEEYNVVPYEYQVTKLVSTIASTYRSEYKIVGEQITQVQDTGVLEIIPNQSFLRVNGYFQSEEDILISDALINKYELKDGDCITVSFYVNKVINKVIATDVVSINGVSVSVAARRIDFKSLIKLYPSEKYDFSKIATTGSVCNYICPIGKGQRAVIIGENNYGRDDIIKEIMLGIKKVESASFVMPLLLETKKTDSYNCLNSFNIADIEYFKRKNDADRFSSITLAMSRAQRMVEMGRDAVLIIDDLNELFELLKRTLISEELAFDCIRNIMFLGSNIKYGASFTLIASLDVSTTNGKLIYEKIKDMLNMELVLSKELYQLKVSPAISLTDSYTINASQLMTQNEQNIRSLVDKILEQDNSISMQKQILEIISHSSDYEYNKKELNNLLKK